MSSVMAEVAYPSVQPVVSHNVRILMAYKNVGQQAIGQVIGKTPGAVSHKLSGRSEWTLDEVRALALFGGPQWPVARFFNDPEGSEPTVPSIRPKLRAIQGGGRTTPPATPLTTVIK